MTARSFMMGRETVEKWDFNKRGKRLPEKCGRQFKAALMKRYAD
jgi:hypothetical protein